MGLLNWLSHPFRRNAPEVIERSRLRQAANAVEFDEHGVKCWFEREGCASAVQFFAWHDLHQIVIITTDEGPFVDDLFWVLSGTGETCVIGSEAAGMDDLLAQLQELPGFHNDAVISAMSSTENAEFLCWRR